MLQSEELTPILDYEGFSFLITVSVRWLLVFLIAAGADGVDAKRRGPPALLR